MSTRDLGKVYSHNLGLSLPDSLLSGSQLSYFQVAMTTPPLSFCNPGEKDNIFHNRASAVLGQATTAECFRVKATKTDNLPHLQSLLSDSPLLYKTCLRFFSLSKTIKRFPGGTVVKNPPASTGDTDSIPDSGRPHMLWSNSPYAPQPSGLCSRVQEPQLVKPAHPRACAPQPRVQEPQLLKPAHPRACAPQPRVQEPQLLKPAHPRACAPQPKPCNKQPMNGNEGRDALAAKREQPCSNEDPPQPKRNK